MNKKTDDGGPAFPWNHNSISSEDERGLSLRDWFAGQAMLGSRARDSRYESWSDLAQDAYDIADAMIKERNKTT